MNSRLAGARAADAFAVVWLGACLVACILVVPTVPVTWDEHAHALYGDAVLRWFATAGADPQALAFRGDSFYGAAYDLLGACVRRICGGDGFAVLHGLGGGVAWCGLVVVWRLARRLDAVTGALALVLLTLTPVYVGHAFANPKDLPFAVGYAGGVLGLALWFEHDARSWKRTALVGVLLGLSCCVRAAGLGLLGMLLGIEMVRLLRPGESESSLAERADAVVPHLVLVVSIAWAVMVVAWPWALQSPLVRPLLSLANLVDFDAHDRLMPFAGEMMRTTEPRRDYVLHMLALKLPLPILVGGGLSVVLAERSKWRVLLPVHAAWVLPIVAVVLVNPVLYDGLRHMLFVVPVACVAAAWGIVAALRRFGPAWSLLAAAGVLAGLVALFQQGAAIVRLHPMQSVWFNPVVGGLEGAQGRYSLDYYGFSYGEAASLLREHVGDRAGPIAVEAAMPSWAGRWTFGAPFQYTRGPGVEEPVAEFYVAYTRGEAHTKYPNSPIVATVSRDGVVLAVVKALRPGGHER